MAHLRSGTFPAYGHLRSGSGPKCKLDHWITSCVLVCAQFLLIVDIAAAVGFIIAGLAGCSWVNFYVQNDASNQPYDLITSYANFSRIQGLFYTCVYSAGTTFFTTTFRP